MRTITPLDIRFVPDAEASARHAGCPVCGAHARATPLLEVPSLAPPHTPLTLLSCGACASVHYDPPGIRDFSDFGAAESSFWRLYAESVGGVWETIWPLLAAGRAQGSLLDIGCGFGFALDFWTRTGRGEAVGVELAEYGAAGARELGVTIHGQLLQDCAALSGRRFDLVYASEVIEHVPDPRAFARLLAERVSEDGVLVMTTPAAEFITPAHRSTTQLAALAPGFHGFLLSAGAFEAALRDAGFAHVTVRRFHERQMAWASRRPLALDFDDQRLRSHYFAYMTERLPTFDPASAVGLGYGYRLLRDLVNTGQFAPARDVIRRLRSGIEAAYGSDALDPARVASRFAAAGTLDDAGRIGPFFLPCYLHFAGAVAQHVEHDIGRAMACYRAAAATARDAARLGIAYFPEAAATFWPARIAEAMLALASGDDSGARVLAEVAERGDALTIDHAFATIDDAQVEALLPPVIEELFTRGRAPAAVTIGEAYLRFVGRRYGPDATAVDALAELASASPRPRPADPSFPPYLAARIRMRTEPDEAKAALAAFATAAERLGGSQALRGRALATRAREAAGLPAPRPAFSFEMSYDLTPRKGRA